jgi:hypothetical protein
MTPEAWNVIALQNFFPEIKIPLAQLCRVAIAAQGR